MEMYYEKRNVFKIVHFDHPRITARFWHILVEVNNQLVAE